MLATGLSIKRALDVEWSDPQQKAEALRILVNQLDALEDWIQKKLPHQVAQPPLAEHLATLRQLREQDPEPDPSGKGPRVRRGVAADHRVSIEDPDMRHGRKSKSKRFDGYKCHIATDLDSKLILACPVTPANRPEQEAAPVLCDDILRLPQNPQIEELHIDRGYIGSSLVQDVLTRREYFSPGSVVEFDPEACARCKLRSSCTVASPDVGRTINTAQDERLQHRLRKLIATPKGLEQLRERVHVEHRLAHVSCKQGRRARYRGTRKNLFDLRRASTVVNLETIHRCLAARFLCDENRLSL